VTGRDVRVVYTKFDGSLHWHHSMQYLGEDEHGSWLGAAAGATTQRGSEPPIVFDMPTALLLPNDGQWWTAAFNGEPSRTEIYCDISTPPRWPHPGEVTMVDLDLDVIRIRADQQVLLLDQDEFADHQMLYRYPDDVIAQAEQAAAWLQEAIKGGSEPFTTVYRAWLELVS